MTSTNDKQFVHKKILLACAIALSLSTFCPYLKHTKSFNAIFSLYGFKETKGNIHVTKSRSQYTRFTSHINKTHTNIMHCHILYIVTNTSTIL